MDLQRLLGEPSITRHARRRLVFLCYALILVIVMLD